MLQNNLIIIGLLLAFAVSSCKQDSSATTATTSDSSSPTANTDGITTYELGSADIPRPAGCNFLPDGVLQEILGGEEAMPISFSSGPMEASCMYRLETKYWAADLMIEVGDGSRAAGIQLEISEALEGEATTVNGHPARVRNDNRILQVAANPPYVVKLSVLPKPGYKEIVDSAQRRQLLEAIGSELEKKFQTQ